MSSAKTGGENERVVAAIIPEMIPFIGLKADFISKNRDPDDCRGRYVEKAVTVARKVVKKA